MIAYENAERVSLYHSRRGREPIRSTVAESSEPGAIDAMNARPSKVSWVLATIVSVVLAVTAAGAANAETGRDPHNRTGSRLLRDIAQTAAVDTAVEWLRTLIPQKTERDTNAAAVFFDIRKEEYERWPEGRRRHSAHLDRAFSAFIVRLDWGSRSASIRVARDAEQIEHLSLQHG